MFGLGITEIVIILIVVGVVFFGGKKIINLAHSMGRFTGEFKKGKAEVEKELKEMGNVAQKTDEKSKDQKRG